MRIVIREVERTVSFSTDADVIPALIAACAAEPRTVEALLLAAEAYYPGLVETVMGEMMRFDLWMQGGATKVRQLRPEPGAESNIPAAFEVVDPLTRQLAYLPDAGGLLIIDLEEREISAPVGTVDLPGRRGSVVSSHPNGEYEIETIYTLGNAWTLPETDGAVISGAVHG